MKTVSVGAHKQLLLECEHDMPVDIKSCVNVQSTCLSGRCVGTWAVG